MKGCSLGLRKSSERSIPAGPSGRWNKNTLKDGSVAEPQRSLSPPQIKRNAGLSQISGNLRIEFCCSATFPDLSLSPLTAGGPRQCDSSLSACLIRNSQFGLRSSRGGEWRSALPTRSANTGQPDHHLA
ncbi:hypothetical protein JOQ06_011446 [Pogonophryne albipinna]|uniref:23-bisphosphoglycerate-independent phosphoglycerate mutase n=2 Tax=Notothenioidei TaxID=8205 RepID=A0AAD9C2E6_DISEL|nr:hypothetical protein JOQ06_011446 [Pogonophryne albipinna]KAK1893282.1 23-bisphosphoglycerate-independent phosphoglycerate mutase [Dissostichus eleginoides]